MWDEGGTAGVGQEQHRGRVRAAGPDSGSPTWDLITTLVDYYGLPDDAPAYSCTPSHVSAHDCAGERQAGIVDEIGDPRLRPFIREAGLDAALAHCPRFAGWISELQELGRSGI